MPEPTEPRRGLTDDRRIVLALVTLVAATVTGDPIATATVTAVAWLLLRGHRSRRDTWDATAAHRRRMDAIRRHSARSPR